MQEEILKVINDLERIEERIAALGHMTEYKGPLIDAAGHVINAKAHLREYIAADKKRALKMAK